ncbi:MAG TPA: transcription antitermination factor NusB [Myxococcota bacterium]|jgi:N utilization substance protein B|nr:transcription antitermination factor NusB [Myxococcota bacterium]
MSAARRASRHRSREAALQILYAVDLARHDDAHLEPAAQAMIESASEHFELPEGARAFAKELVLGVAARRDAIDAVLASHARRWRVSRMAAVDRNILRLAAYELMQTDSPTAVVIDEAVELAARFGGDRSPAFVNGILDAVARTVRAGRGDEPADATASPEERRTPGALDAGGDEAGEGETE